jgi:two-component system nitrate/nitrite response regulator NarL
MPPVRVLLIADDLLTRAGLATLLARAPSCEVVGQVASTEELAAAFTTYLPNAALWDLGWQAEAALERLAELADGSPPIVVLLADNAWATAAWTAGARGLLLRTATVEAMAASLEAVAQGLVVLDPDLATALFSAPLPTPMTSPPEAITPREREVLQLLAEGLPNKAIAQRLGISEHTVKYHVNALLGKLDAQSRTEAVVRATRLGLILL